MGEPGADDAWRGELLRELNRFCNVWDARGPRNVAAGPRDPRPAARGAAQRDPDARDHRHRPRAHRHGVAVAAGGDASASACGRSPPSCALMERYPELPLRLLAGPAIRVDPRPRARALGADPRARRRRAVAPGRRDVGRAGLQPARRRVARTPVRLRPALLRARVRPPRARVLEPRRVRLQRPAAADHARRRHRRLPHAEALVEPVQPARAPHLPLGRDRRLGGARALPAGRHLQRRGDRPRAAPRGPRLQGPRAVGAQPARLRVGRRRRRADGADARDARARRRSAGRPAHDHRRPRGLLRRAGRRGAVARGGRRALPRVPPRDVHDAGAHQAGEPARGAGAARRRAARCRRRMRRGRARSSIGRGRRSCSTTSTTSSRARRSARSTRAPSATWPRSRRAAGARCATASCRRGRQHRRRGAPRGRRRRAAACAFAEAPSCGVGRFVEPRSEVRVTEDGDGFVLENERLRAVLGRDGTLRSLVELASGREAMAAPGNVLELYEDRPTAFEAWDLDPFHLETRSDCPPRLVAAGRRWPTRSAPRSPSSARSAARAACARPCASTPSPRAWSSTARSTGTRTAAR